MLLEDRGGGKSRFEAVGSAGPNNAAQTAQRLAPFLHVVREVVQPTLHGIRRAKTGNESALRPRERQIGWFRRVSGREREPL